MASGWMSCEHCAKLLQTICRVWTLSFTGYSLGELTCTIVDKAGNVVTDTTADEYVFEEWTNTPRERVLGGDSLLESAELR